MSELVAEWLKKAEADYGVASSLLRRRKPPADIICFLCQQAVEKYLKGILQKHGIKFAKTHDLEALLEDCAAVEPPLALLASDAKALVDYAVLFRYPGSDATVLQARRAVDAARRVRKAVLPILK